MSYESTFHRNLITTGITRKVVNIIFYENHWRGKKWLESKLCYFVLIFLSEVKMTDYILQETIWKQGFYYQLPVFIFSWWFLSKEGKK